MEYCFSHPKLLKYAKVGIYLFQEKYKRKLKEDIKKDLFNNIKQSEISCLSEFASKFSDGLRRKKRFKEHFRTKYSRDADRIIHSHAYTRYIDKTQVFFLVDNDHITHRTLHVQLVSKIARTIGRALKLNEDLIEAISVGHDIGHPPFGHLGESILSELCSEYKIGKFIHNAQAVQFLDRIEDKNLTLQVLDGIFCHNGEKTPDILKPNRSKTWSKFDKDFNSTIKDGLKEIPPMTLEGCVVRFADVIAYIGRDIQDAIEVGLIENWSMIPEKCKELIGDKNHYDNIINSLVIDVIENSYKQDYIKFSDNTKEMLRVLREFNYTKIYRDPKVTTEKEKITRMFKDLFYTFLKDLDEEKLDSKIYDHLINLEWVSKDYLEKASNAEKVRDYIAGMTDRYFMETFKEIILPKRVSNFKNHITH